MNTKMRDSLDVAVELLREKRFRDIFYDMKHAGALDDRQIVFLVEHGVLPRKGVKKE